MIGMRYPLDVVFLDEQRRVVHTVSALSPGALSPKVADATSVLELPSGTLARVSLQRGAQIAIETEDGSLPAVASRGAGALLCNALLAALYVSFAIAHFRVGQQTGQWATVLPVVVQETIQVVLFLARRPTTIASSRPFDWVLGITGTFLPLLMRATDELGPLTAIGRPLQVAGLLLVLCAVLFLGRSIGVVAANRGVQTAGPYRFVRHPMYAAHMVGYLGYVLSYPSARNCLIVAVTAVALCGRAVVEERLLGRDPRYREYLDRIQWRFVPFVY
jgi:protein-S-isoprenylcysteine O-methyltransferase Ste14